MELKDYEYYRTDLGVLYNGECLEVLKYMPDNSVNCVITSPPYWALRDYGVDGQLGLEKTFQEYINRLCNIFDEVKRVLKKDGTIWVNLGDTYGGNNSRASNGGRAGYGTEREGIYSRGQDKCLCQIPSRFAIEMTNRGWILRNEIIWYKKNCMPSSVKDRFTVDFEKIFFFVKNKKYWFEQQFDKALTKDNVIRDRDNTKMNNVPGRSRMNGLKENNYDYKNKRAVWEINPQPFPESHFAVFPEKLIEIPLKAGCPKDGVVMDIFMGSGTTALLAEKLYYKWIGIELNKKYCDMIKNMVKHEAAQVKIFKE